MVGKYFQTLLKASYENEISGRTDKKNTVIHASDIFNFCPRKFCICVAEGIPFHTNEYLSNTVALTFDIGKKIQDIVVSRLNKTGKLIGTWYCKNCNSYFYGTSRNVCSVCGSKHSLEYRDTRLEYPITNDISLVGQIDIQVFDNKYIYTGEVKSIGKDAYNELIEPLIQHKYQIMTYLFMLSKSKTLLNGKPISYWEQKNSLQFYKQKGSIIYIPKGGVKNPFEKIFTQDLNNKFVIEITSKLSEVRKFKTKGVLPENRYCKSELSQMSRGCQARRICLR